MHGRKGSILLMKKSLSFYEKHGRAKYRIVIAGEAVECMEVPFDVGEERFETLCHRRSIF